MRTCVFSRFYATDGVSLYAQVGRADINRGYLKLDRAGRNEVTISRGIRQ